MSICDIEIFGNNHEGIEGWGLLPDVNFFDNFFL